MVFGFLMLLFSRLSFVPPFSTFVIPMFATMTAKLSFLLSKALGQPVTLSHTVIRSAAVSLEVTNECSGLGPVWLFTAAVLSFPVAFSRKIPAILLGAFLLLAVNVARVTTLFFVKQCEPGLFEIVHRQLWPAIFIIVSIWAFWFWLRCLDQLNHLRRHV